MGIETPTPVYIDDLDASLPGATDPLSQADDHLRNIKSVLKQTFPNINGPVTSTQAELDAPRAVPAINGDGTNATFNTGIDAAKIKTLVGINEPAITTDGTNVSLYSGIDSAAIRTAIGAQASFTPTTALDVYPVGSIYTTVEAAFDPATAFGGTWEVFGAGKVLVGLDSADTDFDTVEELRGNKTQTLATDNLPEHRHGLNLRMAGSQVTNPAILDNSVNTTVAAGDESITFDDTNRGPLAYQSTTGTQTTQVGSGTAFDLLQPSIVVKFWKRTA